MTAQIDIAEILGELQNGPLLSTHRGRIEAVMRHFCAAGLTLAISGDPRHLNRAESTMKGYCRDFALVFPDYCPAALKVRAPK